jgi:predicted unusual protein kinase regulating ubiquinone biosynthesis (AarF/ABC1/UbiB family)
VTFLDFGMVKRWEPGEWERLAPCLDAILARDPDQLIRAMEAVQFVPAGHELDARSVFEYVSTPYRPYLTDRFRFSRDFVRDTIQKIVDVKGPHADAVRQLNLPASFVILDRVVWGVSALLGKLEIEAPWRQMLMGYRMDDSRGTELGDQEQAWWRQRSGRQ